MQWFGHDVFQLHLLVGGVVLFGGITLASATRSRRPSEGSAHGERGHVIAGLDVHRGHLHLSGDHFSRVIRLSGGNFSQLLQSLTFYEILGVFQRFSHKI